MHVVGVTGMPGSGKSEALQVAAALGFTVVRMGDMIWDEVDARGLPRDPEHVGRIANDMRESEGPDIWAVRTIACIRQMAQEADVDEALGARPKKEPLLILIDGIRSNHEVETFRRELGADFLLVAVHTDPEERHARMTRRARADDPQGEAGHRARDDRELGWGIAQTIAMADEMVVNNADLPSFKRRVEALLTRAWDAHELQPRLK